MATIENCFEIYRVSDDNFYATGLLFENINTSEYMFLGIENNFTIQKGGQTISDSTTSAYISAEGIEMPRNSQCMSVIVPVNPEYTIQSQKLTITVLNSEEQRLIQKTYNFQWILPD